MTHLPYVQLSKSCILFSYVMVIICLVNPMHSFGTTSYQWIGSGISFGLLILNKVPFFSRFLMTWNPNPTFWSWVNLEYTTPPTSTVYPLSRVEVDTMTWGANPLVLTTTATPCLGQISGLSTLSLSLSTTK